MRLLQLPPAELRRQLAGAGVWLRTGPFSLKVQSRIPAIAEGLARLYGQFEVRAAYEASADFHVSVNSPRGLRGWVRPQAAFSFGDCQPFEAVPRKQAFPMLERGLDWCVSTQAHPFLVFDAAAVEKNGLAAVLPATPGSGRSTLAAALALSGWRLLSEKFTLIDPRTGMIRPLPRPVRVNHHSIDLIRGIAPDAYMDRPSPGPEGTIAHLRPPRDSVLRQHESARPGWVIFPRWSADTDTRLVPRSRAKSFIALAQGAFNLRQLGVDGFRVGTALIDQSACYDLYYGRVSDAVAAFDRLASTA